VFARIVTMRIKPNTASEFTQTIEKRVLPILRKQKGFRDAMTFVSSNGTEVVGVSVWDQKDQAETYNSGGFNEVIKELSKVSDGAPRVQMYEVTNSTPHNIAVRPAA
jgi:heme-degrading monooxygenase HmoA